MTKLRSHKVCRSRYAEVQAYMILSQLSRCIYRGCPWFLSRDAKLEQY